MICAAFVPETIVVKDKVDDVIEILDSDEDGSELACLQSPRTIKPGSTWFHYQICLTQSLGEPF